ncbi:hypothetical protein SDC9_48140 [bioreactor metagenome]|uniref:Peptidase M56 domain-containing protein n=1 Tax=bioreactor metagenome TaxID=1076179 RepID=A0A644WDL2_9ZZZZ
MLNTVITSSILIMGLIIMRYLFKEKIKLRLQYVLWLLVAVRLLVPFSLHESSLSVLNAADIDKRAEQIDRPIYVMPLTRASDQNAVVQQGAGAEVKDSASSGYPAQEQETGAATGYAVKTSMGEILRTVWFTGMAAVGLWFAFQNIRLFGKLRKTREPVKMEGSRLPVYLTRCVRSPCLFGVFHPAIYLTYDSLSDERTEGYILAHEETHYRHGDHLWSYLRCVCLAVYWFNPLVWWAAVLSRRDCELACDEGTLSRLGDEHRKAYGNTLINMIASRTKPSDLLCGATTMTSGKRGITERITMIAKKPKMLISTLLAVVLLLGIVVGCTFTGANTKSETAEKATLTAEELEYFNGDKFFNGEDYPNIRNQFLSSLYDSPEEIDLFQLFYCGSGLTETVSDAEKAALIAQNGWEAEPDCACEKISRANMDAILTEYMGISLEDTEKTGLDNFTYLKEYDAYYSYHGDTNYRSQISFSGGEREGDIVRLFYDDVFFCDGEKILTLREKDGGYLFVSNQKTGEEDSGSVANPEGIVAENLSVPDQALTAAKDYVRQQYEYWCNSTGAYGMVDGSEQMIGEPASYDNWRIEELGLAYSYKELDGEAVSAFQQTVDSNWQTLEVYRLDYRIHTTTPDKVVLAGGMMLDDDGWLLPTYPNSTYLVFVMNNGTLQYLFSAMENDCAPGDEVFTNDLKVRLSGAKEAYGEAIAHLNALFTDDRSTIWYVNKEEGIPQTIPSKLSYVKDARYRERYQVLFSCIWEKQSNISQQVGDSLCLGDSADACFQFFLGSDLVVWRDHGNVTAWRVNDSYGATLPDNMMLDFSGYEADIANVTISAQEDESAEDTLHRFLDAYGYQLLNLTQENIYRVTDFKALDFDEVQTKDSRILLRFGMAVKPPAELYQSTFWWAGNSEDGTGELEGYLVMYREMVLERADGVWRCTGFGTGGYSLE